MLFYTVAFPESLIAMIDVCLLLGALWSLHKVKLITVSYTNPVTGIYIVATSNKNSKLCVYYYFCYS